MSHLAKLFLAIGVGAAAATFNWLYLTMQVKPGEYAVVKIKEIKRGETITLEMLEPVGIPGNSESLRKTFIPYQDRQMLDGQVASRDFFKGDILFHRDIAAPSTVVDYELLGPYRLLAVGERISGASETGSGGTNDTVTIAITWPTNDAKTKLLMELTEARPNNDKKGTAAPKAKIERVTLMPTKSNNTPPAGTAKDTKIELKEGEIAIFVSLDGIANVPKVLQAGQEIGFMIVSDSLAAPVTSAETKPAETKPKEE